jgi:hypothetical protein
MMPLTDRGKPYRNDGERVLVVPHSHEFIAMLCPQWVKRRTRKWKKAHLRRQHRFAPRYGSRPTPAMPPAVRAETHTSDAFLPHTHRGETRTARSHWAQREGQATLKGGKGEREREGEREGLAAAAFSHSLPSFSPMRFPFSPALAFVSLPPQL